MIFVKNMIFFEEGNFVSVSRVNTEHFLPTWLWGGSATSVTDHQISSVHMKFNRHFSTLKCGLFHGGKVEHFFGCLMPTNHAVFLSTNLLTIMHLSAGEN